MTEHVHDWGEWEAMYELTTRCGVATFKPTGNRGRECRACHQWEFARVEETK